MNESYAPRTRTRTARTRTARVRRLPGGITLRYSARAVTVAAVLLLACLATALLGLFTGTYRIGAGQVLDALTASGSGADRFIVVDQRLPRICAALLVGACLGLSGALFQSLARNPLASPDVIGFTTGSTSGALTVILY
ncbi:iron chelate uptake ABC transporter family permease subunit, partial [Streptomyces niveus]|uniref:iron chelate uptake ABC transporter family permease subunit n=1 Tax=Streptomyces niveus TaxID=193462 RepID=UPI003426449A